MTQYAANSQLVFDLGMNNGDDTEFYLRRNFRVLALDANPILCDNGRRRFSTAIKNQSLTIINAAIWDQCGETTFHINLDNDHWSSLDIGWAGRDGSRCREIRIQCLTLVSLFDQFGVPHYLKIDVEGVDHVVLDQLQALSLLPLYVSIEDCRFGPQYIQTLASYGYNGFKLIDQSKVGGSTDRTTGHTFPAGSSGPFGPDLPGRWLSPEEMLSLYYTTVRNAEGERLAPRSQWWDIHCTHRGETLE
jgi:FkbM family methyltransferase